MNYDQECVGVKKGSSYIQHKEYVTAWSFIILSVIALCFIYALACLISSSVTSLGVLDMFFLHTSNRQGSTEDKLHTAT